MPVSPDGILEAVFDPVWATVRLIIDGGMWPDPVNTLTVTRSTPGGTVTPVRSLESRPAVGGYYVGSDHEMDLDTLITYQVSGYLGAVFVALATVTVSTVGAVDGMWLKVAGAPDLTMRAAIRSIPGVSSPTIGDVYQIAGGGGSVAQWSGAESDSTKIILSVDAEGGVARLRAILDTSRVLLLQPVGATDLDSGWYFIRGIERINPAQVEEFPQRWFTLYLQRTGIPAGAGSGIVGTSWATLMDTYPTWADVIAAEDTWFDVLKGF